MSNTGQEIVYEGWLTKSPPSKRIWKAKWRRRWFALRQSGELPGQYYLDYYSDRNYRKLKGRIDLDLCNQVDAGLYMESGRGGGGSVRSVEAGRGTVFSVRTSQRVYHLKADCEADMEKWVDAICSVCGLRRESASPPSFILANHTGTTEEQPTVTPAGDASPYIPISECITGPKSPESVRPRTHTMDAHSIVTGGHRTNDDVAGGVTEDNSDNDSTRSAEESTTPVPARNNGPPVPPRPERKFLLVKDGTHRDCVYIGSDSVKYTNGRPAATAKNKSEYSNNLWRPPYKEGSSGLCVPFEEDRHLEQHTVQVYTRPTVHYYNMTPVQQGPIVDRNLKPKYDYPMHYQGRGGRFDRGDTVHYLDLDLHAPSTSQDRPSTSHSRSRSVVEDSSSAYKTVDFLKTEAFNMTRRDAEALRRSAVRL